MTRTHRHRTALATVGILLLAGCSTGASEDEAPATTEQQAEAHPVGTELPEADTTGMWLPLNFQDARIVDPGWDAGVRYADGVFIGATQREGAVEFSAVDVNGEVLWATQDPPEEFTDGTEDLTAPAVPGATHVDLATGASITLEGTELRAEDSTGSELWRLSVEEGSTVAGLAGGLLYLREGDAIRAHNVMTGAVARAYDPESSGRVIVPRTMVTQGAALLLDGSRPLIALAPQAPTSG